MVRRGSGSGCRSLIVLEMAELEENWSGDREVEMSAREAEVQVLVQDVVRTSKGDSKARAAYRAEMQSKRSLLLLVMIVPILLIIVAWSLFGGNSEMEDSPEQPAASYVNSTTSQS